MRIEELHISGKTEFFSSILDGAPFGIIVLDLVGEIQIVNYLARQYLELPYELKDLPGKNIMEFVSEIPQIEEAIGNCFTRGRKPFNLETIPFGGNYLNFKGRLIPDGYLVIIENITRLKEIETDTLHAMIEGQELERKRLAKDIHDGLGPVLSTVKLNLEGTLTELGGKAPHDSITNLQTAIQLIDSMAMEMRTISHSLMPRVLEDFGLVDALESLCNRLDNTNRIKVSFIHSGVNERFDKLLELGLYRISQELLNNALKHSRAQSILIQLIHRADSLMLMVEDDGIGFNPEDIPDDDEGIGLQNIESRAKALGGDFFLDAAEGRGVIATIEIPLNAEDDTDEL